MSCKNDPDSIGYLRRQSSSLEFTQWKLVPTTDRTLMKPGAKTNTPLTVMGCDNVTCLKCTRVRALLCYTIR
ncbi:hypothetical protein GQX74_009030 [Glossina fuscipes]|nr:hypothetical protein GQX74_009030 [Glossina fuscipes]